MSISLHRLGAGFAGLLLALLVAVPALAHAELVASIPEDGEVLATPPTAVELRLSEGVDGGKSSFRLVGPDGEVGTGTLNRDGGRVMRLDGLQLGPGEYAVRWTIGSADGHVERGTLRFTVSEPTPPAATQGPPPTEAPSPDPSAAPTAASTAAPSDAPASGSPATPDPAGDDPTDAGQDVDPVAGSGTDALIPIVAGLALVGLAGTFVMRRSRRA